MQWTFSDSVFFYLDFFSPMNYNIDIVLETLNITLKQALQKHPQQVSWLRIEGDLEFRTLKNTHISFHFLFKAGFCD